ncbi:MAG: short-chain dehydrogenase/reductase [Rhizobacter sp.]|nr:short-chain dehydrogenase/reductase [Rhizobacter sp.]
MPPSTSPPFDAAAVTKPAPAYVQPIVLEGQPALVTGGDSGIGRGIAIGLAQAGADVIVNYAHNEEAAKSAVAEIEKLGRRAIAIQADVSQEAEVEAMFAQAIQAFGTLHIVVSNSGLQKDSAFLDMSLDDWNKVIGVNLTGQFLCARAAAREFRRRGVVESVSAAAGKLICVSSVHEVIPWAGHANYAASKGGVMLLMKTLAQELAPLRIRVNSIAPGAIKTPINKDAWSTPEALESLARLMPYGRIGQPEDIARAAIFLASDASDYMTGTSMFVDGGMALYPEFAKGG